MNTLITLSAVLIAGVSAGVISTNSGVELNEACLVEYGIDPEYMDKDSEEMMGLTLEQAFCVAACIYRDYGIMRPDGTIDEVVADSYFDKDGSEERDIFYTLYNTCNDGKTGCKLVQCMFEELRDQMGIQTDFEKLSKNILSGKGLIIEYA